jgi:4-diphosphocytidyl-2-C-methyl-D-erythritol kinase/energy-coupling factor transport system substrate-specific component
MSLKQKMKFIENITTDGPYMLVGLPCRVKGNGNIISPIKYNLKAKMLIVKPKIGCNTKDVFSSLDYKKLKRYNINKIQEALSNNDLDLLSSHIGNSLLPSAININKDILDVINRMKTCGFEIVSMSGSGSTCFAISKRKYPFKKAKEIFDKEKYDLIKVCKIIK